MTNKPSRNYVLHAKSKQFYWEGDGQLSIKTFRNGRAHYKTSKGFFAVEEGRYLLLNEGEYTISIGEDEERPFHVERSLFYFPKTSSYVFSHDSGVWVCPRLLPKPMC
ncbi:hypothetical protein BP422_24715 [Brevibacillus formosus]|uniref:Uncharacterized protein n=1 Tax=Brevibacillus formosus TaxID=54913 RepID=A0A220MNF9_9BACL|nr:hypothetical protein BP422_24715 [Brevibacillus formosus]